MITLQLDVHEYSVLIEAAWGAGTGLRMDIVRKAVDHWFHKLHPRDAATIHEFFSERMNRFPAAADLQAHFLARYDPENQYMVTAGGRLEHCYSYEGRYHVQVAVWMDPLQIDRVVKLTPKDWLLEANILRDQQVRSKAAPPCPRCGEKAQIQFMNSLARPALWRCRTCKHGYKQEQA